MKNLLFSSLLLSAIFLLTDCNSQGQNSNTNQNSIFSIVSAKIAIREANIVIEERNSHLHDFIKLSTEKRPQSKQRKDKDNLKLKKDGLVEILDQLKTQCEKLASDKNGKPDVLFNFELSMNQELVNKLVNEIKSYKSFSKSAIGDPMMNMPLHQRLEYILVTDAMKMGITDSDWSHLNFDKVTFDSILLNIERIKNEILVVENILLEHIYSFCDRVGY